VGAWIAELDVADGRGIALDHRFFLEGDAFRGRRPHQVRLPFPATHGHATNYANQTTHEPKGAPLAVRAPQQTTSMEHRCSYSYIDGASM
jgi:hypothetical protein